MSEYFLSYNDLLIIVIVGVILGALFGLVPLLLGRRRNKARLGMYGFVASIVAGALTPILSLIVVAIFSWMIVRTNSSGSTGTDSSNNAPTPNSASE